MDYFYIVMIIYTIPFILLIWSAVDLKFDKKKKLNWKLPLLVFIIIFVVSVVFNVYISNKYNLSIFPNLYENIISLSLVGAIIGVMGLINIGVTIYARKHKLPKSFHNSKVMWMIIGTFATAFLFFFIWYMPLGQKLDYVKALEAAVDALDEGSKNRDFPVVFIGSRGDCISNRNCDDEDYENIFFIKNNLEKTKEVQIKIRALDKNEQQMTIIDSKIMEIDPGEYKLIVTEDTNEDVSTWDKYTFQTDEQVHYFQHKIRYREPN